MTSVEDKGLRHCIDLFEDGFRILHTRYLDQLNSKGGSEGVDENVAQEDKVSKHSPRFKSPSLVYCE